MNQVVTTIPSGGTSDVANTIPARHAGEREIRVTASVTAIIHPIKERNIRMAMKNVPTPPVAR